MSKLTPILVHAIADLEIKVEAKVKAASTASAATGFIVTLLGGLAVFHGGAVPSVITAAVGAAVTGGLTFLAGYMARHTPRVGDLPPVPAAVVAPTPVTPPAAPTQ